MKYVSAEYGEQLRRLSETLNPRVEPAQGELDLNSYAEVADVIIERTDMMQLGRAVLDVS